MPQYIKNTVNDIDFLSDSGIIEYMEDELSNLPPVLLENDCTKLLFSLLREKCTLEQLKQKTKSVKWAEQPFEIQAIAVGLKLFKR